MGLLSLIAEALRSLRRNKVRTALSVLGIVIGIGAVIAIVAMATGAQRAVERQIQSLGNDWAGVWYWGQQRGGTRIQGGTGVNEVRDQADAVRRECAAVRTTCVLTRTGSQVVSSYGNVQTTVRGIEPSFFDIRRWGALPGGRVIEPEDEAMRSKVAVIGLTPTADLFGAVNPVGQTIRINQHAFVIVGVLEPKGAGSSGEDDEDDVILVPFSVYQPLLGGNRPPRAFLFAATAGASLDEARRQVTDVLRQQLKQEPGEPDAFRMFDRAEDAAVQAEVTMNFNLLLTWIAAISLVVGGVGIMNIMLVSVTERTREIGLRMAIGANANLILGQFLCEAIVLCGLGGVLGFGLGWAGSLAGARFLGWQTEISYWMAGVAIAFSTAIGVFFGFYPAWRASRLDPIEALRTE
jgi:putative ABC transport system permease protein